MPKRQPKPEPITPEEVMGSPALQGFDSFLRYRSRGEGKSSEDGPGKLAVDASIPKKETAEHEIPQALYTTPPVVSPMGVTPLGNTSLGLSPAGPHAAIAEFKPGPKIRRALKVQDGHSAGEQAIYQALWTAAAVETPDTRLIRIGYGGLQSLCGLDKTNCKDNIQSLIRKLAVEIVSPFSIQRNQGNVYRIFSTNAILRRRKAAGMEWVIRNKGVRFVSGPPECE